MIVIEYTVHVFSVLWRMVVRYGQWVCLEDMRRLETAEKMLINPMDVWSDFEDWTNKWGD